MTYLIRAGYTHGNLRAESESMAKGQQLIVAPNSEIIEASGVHHTLSQIRPEWQSRNLILRVQRILPIDPSSACQRLFNASIHDLREKILVAGIDIAQEAARQHKLPPISKGEDIEDYSVLRTIDLSYRMGLLSRPDWRRLLRAYDIRKDLEHEDDEYEAEVQDCVYIFKTCIDIVLSKDPVQLIKLTDIKEIVEQPSPTTLTTMVLEEYQYAPEPRQMEIYKFLISYALDVKQPDIVRQNCYNALISLRDITIKGVLFSSARNMVEHLGRRVPDIATIRVAFAARTLPYLKSAQLHDFFNSYLDLMNRTSFRWTSHASHGELLRNLQELGGLNHCPDELVDDYLEWLALCCLGEPGEYGLGINRKVFYSNVGEPIALSILRDTNRSIAKRMENIRNKSERVKIACSNEHIARRFERILDEIEP